MYLMKNETVAESLRSYYSVNYIKKELTSYEAGLLVHKTFCVLKNRMLLTKGHMKAMMDG